jgi:hypothetical protein
MKGILAELGKQESQSQLIHVRPNPHDLIYSECRSLMELAKQSAKRRGVHWAKSHLDERIEIEQERNALLKMEETFRKLDEAMESHCGGIGQDSSDPKLDPVIQAAEFVTTAYHKARRSLMNPKRLLLSAYGFRLGIRLRSALRATVSTIAGVAIFLVAGHAHKLSPHNWLAALIIVPITVAILELIAHRQVEHFLHKWEKHDLQRVRYKLAKVRILAVVDNALANWAIQAQDSLNKTKNGG